MMFNRRFRLPAILFCSFFLALLFSLQAQQNPTQQPPSQPTGTGAQGQQPQQQQPQPQEPRRPNPFETVPIAPAEPKPAAPAAPPPSTIRQAKPGQPPEDIIEAIEFRGARRVPQDTLRAVIFTKKGDPYNAEALHRDFLTLWNQGR